MAVVNLAEDVVGGVLLHAERLRGAMVAADAGAIESLRWAGALPLLLRDMGVPRLLATALVWRAVADGPAAVLAQLRPMRAWRPDADTNKNEDDDGDEGEFIDHLVLLVSGFLWEYETRLQRLLEMGVVRRLTVCSSLSERAHECFDFGAARQPQKMAFDSFAAALAVFNGFKSRQARPRSPRSPRKQASPRNTMIQNDADDGDEWGWGEDGGFDDNDAGFGQDSVAAGSESSPAGGPALLEGEVVVVHLPLNYAPLLHSKGIHASGEPSLFVLSHPICATAFPLLLTRVLRHQQRKQLQQAAVAGSGVTPASAQQPLPSYSHVKEVLPEHIPGEFRRTLKLVAYALGEILVQSRLDAKERIYALGNTSLKIGHTLLKILNDLEEDLTTHTLQSHQAATVVLVDRTSDLASPCSFGVSLLDRVLALLPQSPHQQDGSYASQTNRKGLHVTEIFPLHGCEPSPLSVNLPVELNEIEYYMPSSFVSGVKWKGGASLCHPSASHGMNVFRSLAFRPAKLALRDLDKRLQEVEKELVLQRKITRGGSSKKPGEKPQSTRGRDVVLRRMANILDAGEPTNREHSALIELGIIILETLERMERVQTQWDTCRERTTRHAQLRKQGAGEWIVPELADTVQRQFVAAKSVANKSGPKPVAFHELLTLLVHAYSLSSGSPVEDYTLQMIRNVVGECILEASEYLLATTAVVDPTSIERLCPELLANLSPYLSTLRGHNVAPSPTKSAAGGGDGDEEGWDWDESQSPRAAKANGAKSDDDEYERLQARAMVETHMDRLLSPLKECAQLFAKQNDAAYRSAVGSEAAETAAATPRSLLANVCATLVGSEEVAPSTRGSIAELEHIVDASEQLTRAGIDLLKSGFSRFGFGGSGGASGGPSAASGSVMAESKILVIFVVGGVTFEEVQEVHAALEGNTQYQVIVGGTTITNSDIVLEQLFR